jgi:hypothetical protein
MALPITLSAASDKSALASFAVSDVDRRLRDPVHVDEARTFIPVVFKPRL